MGTDPQGWRIEHYVEMGFTYPQACALGETRDANGVSVYWRDVALYLRAATCVMPPLTARDVVFDTFA
jgi:hypothetical protein